LLRLTQEFSPEEWNMDGSRRTRTKNTTAVTTTSVTIEPEFVP
jgi:hypothetical protein